MERNEAKRDLCFQVGSGWPMVAWFAGYTGGSWFTALEMRRQFESEKTTALPGKDSS